jgi:hypothetical protein
LSGKRRRLLMSVRETWPGFAVTVIFGWLGAGMLLQPSRWYATPAYGALLQVAPIKVWGAAYLAVAVLMIVYFFVLYRVRWYAITTHFLFLVLSGGWWLAFVARWLSDDKTTNANVGAWGLYTFMVLWSLTRVEDEAPRPAAHRAQAGSPA